MAHLIKRDFFCQQNKIFTPLEIMPRCSLRARRRPRGALPRREALWAGGCREVTFQIIPEGSNASLEFLTGFTNFYDGYDTLEPWKSTIPPFRKGKV